MNINMGGSYFQLRSGIRVKAKADFKKGEIMVEANRKLTEEEKDVLMRMICPSISWNIIEKQS